MTVSGKPGDEPSLYEQAQAVIGDTEFGRVAMRAAYMDYRLRTIEPVPFEVFEHGMHIYATQILKPGDKS